MALHFIFVSQKDLDRDNLHQGDILQKTSALQGVIGQAHRYYADAEDYHFFMVLTQSCDLVRRKSKPKTPYITIAAVRPAQILIDRLIEQYTFHQDNLPIALCHKERELDARQYLERLLNNTADSVFFIRKDAYPAVREDYCVFLPLSIALRVEHYETCLAAKIAQLNDVFQAKIGWLTSNMYGRVGTPDLSDWLDDPDTYKRAFYEEVLYKNTVWLSRQQYARFNEEMRRRGGCETGEDARGILDSIKDDIEVAAHEVAEVLFKKNILAGDDKEEAKRKAANLLINARVFRRLVTRGGGE